MVTLALADASDKTIVIDLDNDIGKSTLIGIVLGTCACTAFKLRIERLMQDGSLPDDLYKECLIDKFRQWEAYSEKLKEKNKEPNGYYPDEKTFVDQKKEWDGIVDRLTCSLSDFYNTEIRPINPGTEFNFKKNSEHIYRTCLDGALLSDFTYLSSSIAVYRIRWAIIKSIRYSLAYISEKLSEEDGDPREKELFDALYEMSSFGLDSESSMWSNASQPPGFDGLLEIQRKIIDSGCITLLYPREKREYRLDQHQDLDVIGVLNNIGPYMKGVKVEDGRLEFRNNQIFGDDNLTLNQLGQPVAALDLDDDPESKRIIEGFSKKQYQSFLTVKHPGNVDFDNLSNSFYDYSEVINKIRDNINSNKSTIVYGGTGSGKTAACFLSFVDQYNRHVEEPNNCRIPLVLHPEKLMAQFSGAHNTTLKLHECEEVMEFEYYVIARTSCLFIDMFDFFFADDHDAFFRAINNMFRIPMVIFCSEDTYQAIAQ